MKQFTRQGQVLICLLLIFSAVGWTVPAWAAGPAGKPEAWQITGRVTSRGSGEGLPGVAVVEKGTTNGTSSDVNGNFTLSVPENRGTLVFSFIGMQTQEVPYTGPGVINVALIEDMRALQEVVVTGYTTQNRRDITGAVSVVKPEDLLATPAGNVQQQMQGRVAGVVTSGTGVPGAGAKVRVRGFGSFGNNDPLYIIDGVPTYNVNNINPQDIESMQVLKDASSASIYGARAANGVVIITTKRGKPGASTITVDSYYGVQQAPRGPDLLNTQELGDVYWRQHTNVGLTPTHGQYGSGAQPRIPDYILAGPASGVMEGNPNTNPDLYNIDFNSPRHQIVRANKEGTDWWNETFRLAPIQSHQLTANGGSESAIYSVGLNYFNQQGIARYTGYDRYSLRANTELRARHNFRIGQNAQISYNEFNGTSTGAGGGESGILQIYRMQPIVPVYDIMGNFAGTAGQNLGNASNPVADLWRAKDNKTRTVRMFGNVYGELDLFKNFTARTAFGVDYSTNYFTNYGFRTYERAENVNSNRFDEGNNFSMNWVWTNTLKYQARFADAHDLTVLVGTEAVKESGRSIQGWRFGYFTDDPLFRVLDRGAPSGQENRSSAYAQTLASIFGRVDYTLMDRYLFNATLRRDGSSRFGPQSRYGVFPAFSLGWRLSSEPFMQGVTFVDELKVRAGWGQMGNQLNVNPANAYTFYRSTPANSFYDIAGVNTGAIAAGFDTDRIGNPTTRWEAATTTNIGIDAVFFNSRLEMALDYYVRDTEGLLVTAQAPGTLGHANLPAVNIGDVRNTGIDLMLGTRGEIGGGGLRYDVALTLTHYKNEVLRVGTGGPDEFRADGGTRFGPVTRTMAGRPISSFWGYQIAGFYNTEAEVNEGPTQSQKRVGSWRIRDINDDGVINADDQTFIGNPHPDFSAGLNFTLAYRNFDFNIFLYSVVGNEIYNYGKWWTDFNAFQGNRSRRLLEQSYNPAPGADNSNAVLPLLNAQDTYSNSISHDYYVEDGSYLRARTVQLGYNIPQEMGSRIGLSNLRVYVQAQNPFTITRYQGIDPDVNFAGGELGMGIDSGGWYPNPKQYLLGISLGF